MSSKPKQTAEQKELERISIERERQLRVENARETTKTFSDNIAFRKKLRGVFSLLSNGFKGFQLGSGGGRELMAGNGGGGGAGGAGGINGGSTAMAGGTPASGGMGSRRGPIGRRGSLK